MPFIDLGNGNWAHINMGRQRRKRCSFCSLGWGDKLCDFPVGPDGKTCDRSMCNRCATTIAEDVDYCPRHKGQAAQGALAL